MMEERKDGEGEAEERVGKSGGGSLMADGGRKYREKYGEWALVTGASAGIGLEFAKALAREGLSIVLTARREHRLNALAGDLKEKYGIDTRVVIADLAANDGVDRLADAVADLPIAFLVNNAGFGYAGRFDKLATERLRSMVVVNCVVPVVLTSRILPGMIDRGRGAVIVVGSVAGRQPLPLHAVYSATKGFDQLFGEGLWGELRGTGIDVLVLEPGPTKTEFQGVAGEAVGEDHGEPPENVVRVAFDALGKQPSVISGWFNWVRANAVRIVPRSTAVIIAKRVIQGQTPVELR
jgi:uncharacterized protein